MANQSTRREIVFSARDNGVNSVINQLRQSANQLGRELINEAMSNSRSAREAISYYEQQIRLIERRNRVTRESSRIELENRYQAAGGRNASEQARNQYRDGIADLNRESREDQIQIELLRELIQTVRNTSNQEIRQDRINSINEIIQDQENNEDLIALSDQLNEESGRGRNGRGGGRGDGDDRDGPGRRAGTTVAGVANAGRVVAGSDSPVEAASGAATSLSSNPWLLAIAAIVGVGMYGLQRRAERELATSTLAGIMGTSTGAIVDSQLGTTDMGQYGPIDLNVTREQFLANNLPAAIRARGSSAGGYGRAMGILELERGFGLSDGTGVGLEKLGAVISKNTDAQFLTSKIYGAALRGGAVSLFGDGTGDSARLQAIMQGFTSFRESQFMGSGSTNYRQTLNIMSALQRMGGNFRRDDYVFDTISRLNSGLQGGTAEAQSIKFGILRQLNPNMDYFDLQTEMGKGTDSPGYLANVIKMVKARGGTESQQKIWLNAILGGSMRGEDIKSIIEGGFDPSNLDNAVGGANIDFKKRAVAASSQAKMQVDFGSEAMMDAMAKIGEKVSEIAAGISKIAKRF